ncbi:glycosyltransferase [Stieleria varia]|uniref:Poly-beta-1,6-N-acetyl-D-glucosamine synthase n=1 Tax=Stieleria varia TaxID=2528005 RepID=A0A5C6AQC3_9BACT|nr:glycosyltransferase [Stieleria varia]TWU01276.1 Poly-beta-1,6-N-acetyl-D-glucosamine synthase [Stieleria varia]
MKVFLFVCIVLVAWPYLGYPVWLWLLSRILGEKNEAINASENLPTVTLIISAFNEGPVIRQKLENLLELDYPTHLLDVMVISDASDDGTDDIVREFSNLGVSLYRQQARQGKSAGLSAFAPLAKGDYLLFSDANAIFDPSAVSKLIRHFSDSNIGYVVGQQKYVTEDGNDVGESEGLYWRYETWIKRHESLVDSVVGGDGAIYAIRKELFSPLRYDDINDFVNPLQIISKGYRGVYEPDAVCYERAAGSYEGEYRRKVRIVNRSIRALWRVPVVMNPFRHGLFSFHVISHKLLRWFAVFFMLGAFACNLLLVVQSPEVFVRILMASQVLIYTLAAVGLIPAMRKWRVVSVPFYFCLANLAAGCGVLAYFIGKRYVTWTPDRGEAVSRPSLRSGWLLWLSYAVVMCMLASVFFRPLECIVSSGAILFFAYVIYPLLMWCWPKRVRDTLHQELPTLAVLIPAHNEIDSIDTKIENTLALNYPTELLSIYVVDDASDDGTTTALHRWQDRVHTLSSAARSGKSAAIARAVKQIDSEVILLTDANVLVDEHAAKRLVQVLSQQGVGCATGNVVLHSEFDAMKSEGRYQSVEVRLQALESGAGSAVSVDGGLYAIRRESLVCPPANTILDDFAISAHLINRGAAIAVVTDAFAHEASCSNLSQDFKRRIRLGEGISQTLRLGVFPSPKFPMIFFQFMSHKWLRWMSPFVILAIVLSLLQMAIDYQMTSEFALGVAALLAVAVAGAMLPGVRKFAPFSIFSYLLVVILGMALGMLKGIVLKPSPTWQHAHRSTMADPAKLNASQSL